VVLLLYLSLLKSLGMRIFLPSLSLSLFPPIIQAQLTTPSGGPGYKDLFLRRNYLTYL
jgi:hypothetical protein